MIFDKVKETIIDKLNCDAEDVTMEADLRENLGADSLDALELIMSLEEEYEMTIPDEEAQKLKTVADIVNYIEAHQ